MPFPQLEKVKQGNTEVADLLTALELYLTEVLARPPRNHELFYESGAHDINPWRIARKLKTTNSRAIALLCICDRAGIVRPRYDIYCPEEPTVLITRANGPKEVPAEVQCGNHTSPTNHSINTYQVDLVFEFTPDIVQGELGVAV